jgi:hypothetical protein
VRLDLSCVGVRRWWALLERLNGVRYIRTCARGLDSEVCHGMYGGGVCVRSLVPWRRLVHLDVDGRAAAVRLPGARGPRGRRAPHRRRYGTPLSVMCPLTSRDLTRGA